MLSQGPVSIETGPVTPIASVGCLARFECGPTLAQHLHRTRDETAQIEAIARGVSSVNRSEVTVKALSEWT